MISLFNLVQQYSIGRLSFPGMVQECVGLAVMAISMYFLMVVLKSDFLMDIVLTEKRKKTDEGESDFYHLL
jgi:hypothetical protein